MPTARSPFPPRRPRVFLRNLLILKSLLGYLLTLGGPAFAQQTLYWNQGAGGDFNAAGNWNPVAVPGLADTTIFNIPTANVSLAANATAGSIVFDSGATTFSLGSLAGSSITMGNNGTVAILSTLTAPDQTFTINAPLVLTPDSPTTAGAFTIANDGTSSSTVLVIAGGISSGTTTGTETLSLAGTNTGANLISGVISNGGAASLALVKSGSGTWTLSSANTYTGSTSIAAGTLALTGGNNRLASTGTLNFTGAAGTLDIGSTSQTLAGMTFLSTGNNTHVIKGSGGTLSLTGPTFLVSAGNSTAASAVETVDMTGLSNFSYVRTTGSFNVGGTSDFSSASTTGNATLNLATTNIITTGSFTIGHYTTGINSLNTGTVHLGQTNTLNASTIVVGGPKTTGTLDFQNLVAPTLKIRGTGGLDTDRATMTVGVNDSGLTAGVGTVDLTNGGTVASVLDAKISTLRIGQNQRNSSSLGQGAVGTFIMGQGTLDATTIIVGQQSALTGVNTFSGAATGTFTLNGGTVTAVTLTLADKLSGAASATITSTFNLNSGTLNATTIERGATGTGAGANSATINFNWVDGTISNIAGSNQTVNGKTQVNGLTGGLNIVLNNTGNVSGTHTWNVSGSQTSTVQSTVTLSGTGGLTKTGTGMLSLGGAGTYAGPTAVNGGTLKFSSLVSFYNNDQTMWTSTNLTVASGATAAFNVGGAGEFTASDIDALRAQTGFSSGSFIGLDTTNAGGVFTYGSSVANTAQGPKVLGLTKLGTGTLELTGQNTYSGGTNIAAGTLALSGGDNRLWNRGVLNFTGSSGTLDVGSTSQTLGGLTFLIAGTNTNTITGTGGTLNVTGGNIHIGGGSTTSTGVNSTTVNMSGLSIFNYNNAAGTFSVGGRADVSVAVSGSGILTMATTNTITASKFSVSPFSSGQSSPNTGIVHLGQTNTINASIIEVGVGKSTSTLDFQNLNNPTLKIRGTGGTDLDRAAITVGTNDTGAVASFATVDLVTGVSGASTLDAMVSTLLIGQNTRNNAGLGFASTGTFIMGLGNLNATSIILGQQTAVNTGNASGAATGTLSLNGGTITATTLTLANKLSGVAAQTITSNLNLNSGFLYATTIQRGTAGTGAGADTATINFNWVDGTIGNVAGSNQTVTGNTAINGLTGGLNIVLNNTGNVSGTHTWNVSGTQTATIQSTAILSGSGSLTKTGTGFLRLEGANTYTGLTTVSGGVLELNTTGGQSIAGNIAVSGGIVRLLQSNQINATRDIAVNGGSLDLQTFNQTVANVQLNGGTITGTTGVLTSTSAFDLRSGTVTGILGGTAGVTKTTSGTVILSSTNIYTGGTTVSGGTLIATTAGALGTNNSLSIASGATFAYRPATPGALNLGTGTLTLAGGSTIGTALGSTLSQSVISSSVAASASGAVKVNFYISPGITPATGTHNLITAASGLTSGGASYTAAYYNLTNVAVSGFQATDTTVSVNVASATALTAAYWKGGLSAGNNVWAISDGTSSNWVTNANGTGATPLVPGSGATVTFSATGATNQGSMTLGASMSIRNLVVNDISGITLNADGNTLTVANASGILVNSGAGAVTLNAAIALGATQTWTNSSSNTLTIGGPVSLGAFVLTSTGTGNTVISGALSGTAGVSKNGSGTLTLSGANTNTGSLSVNVGKVNISGSYQGAITVGGGTKAILEISSGASLSGTAMAIGAGAAAGSSGAVYQTGGDILFNGNFNLGLGGTDVSKSYGFYSMSSGNLTDTGGSSVRFRMGGGGSNSLGVFYQSGGSITIVYANGLEVGANASGGFVNSTGVTYLTGGTFTAASNRIGFNQGTPTTGGIRGEQTVAGNALVTINGTTTLALVAGDTGILNLNGGIYATRQITKGIGTSIINFNGGTLKAASSATLGTFLTGLTQANVHAGGVTFDTNGQAIVIGQSLLAPAGNGVTTIAVTDGGSGYVGPPVVEISGTGTGATAVANMVDDGTGNGTFKIASITITSPGTGYTGTPTVTLSGGGGAGAILDSAAIAANTSGGITKTGNGSLTLSGTNTYTGATIVRTGILQAGSNSAFGINSATTVDATLRLAGRSVSLGSLAGAGTVDNTNATAAVLTLGGDNTSTVFSGTLQNGTGAGNLSLVKTGTGVQTLSHTNTYTGTTTVSQGTLQIGLGGLGSTSASSAVNVNGAGATLAGTGFAAGTVTVTSGLLKPGDNGGDSTGTLNVGSLNLTTGGTAVLQLEGASSYDSINVVDSGGLTLNGKLNVTTSLTGSEFDNAFAIGTTFNLLDWVSALNGSFDAGTNFRNGSTDNGLQFDLPDLSALTRYWDVSNFLIDGTVVVVVPEPGRAFLLLIALGALVTRRRRPAR